MNTFIINKNTDVAKISKQIENLINESLKDKRKPCGICFFTYSKNQEYPEILILSNDDIQQVKYFLGIEDVLSEIKDLKYTISSIQNIIGEDKQIKINFESYNK